MEVLLHSGTTVLGWRTADIHQAILASFALSPDRYSITQLRYDLRKIKAHGLLERDGRRYAYRLTDYGTRPLCASCSSISASAVRSPTASFTTDPIKPVGLTRNSTPPTAKPTAPSTKSFGSWLLEARTNLREKSLQSLFKNLVDTPSPT
jgi:hypothetical protein